MEDGVLCKEDLEGPVKEGSTEDRLKGMEHEVFKFKKMVERGFEVNFDIIKELKTLYLEELRETWSSMLNLKKKQLKSRGRSMICRIKTVSMSLGFQT